MVSQSVASGQPAPGVTPISVFSGNREQLRYLLQRGTTTTAAEFTTLMSSAGGVATSSSSVGLETPSIETTSVAMTSVGTSSSTTTQGVTTSRVWVPGTARQQSLYKTLLVGGFGWTLGVSLIL
jgi:hypothetical protein